jgi:hypothetical protein
MVAFVENLRRDAPSHDVAAQLELACESDAKGDREAALCYLRRAAAPEISQPEAALGCHLLAQPPADIAEGVKQPPRQQKRAAARRPISLALFIAAGITVPQSWRTALDFLEAGSWHRAHENLLCWRAIPISRRQSRGVRVLRSRLGIAYAKDSMCGSSGFSPKLAGVLSNWEYRQSWKLKRSIWACDG